MNVSGCEELFDKLVAQQPINQFILTGDDGTGRTDTAFLIAQRWQNQLPDERYILTNLKDVDGTIHVESRYDVDKIVSDEYQYMIVLDEYNYTYDEHLFRIVTYLRKKNVGYAVTLNETTKIHPWINALCDIVYKEDKQTASVYDGMNRDNLLYSISDLDSTELEYDVFQQGDKL